MDILRATIDTDREIVKRGRLYDFVEMAWHVVEPSEYVHNWHIEEICNHLEAVSRCEILRLIVNQPPGTGKSSIIGVFWPVWEWIFRAGTKFIFASFDASLVGTRDGGKVLKLLESEWFKARWGNMLEPGKQATSMFQNRKGGFRFATSTGGKVLGRHGDIQVVDDPIKPKDAAGGGTMKRTVLQAVSAWWSGTMSSRMASVATGRRVIVMQRLGYDDLAGEMLATGDYVHVRFPMRYEPDWPCKTDWGKDRRTVAGELLFPERFPAFAVDRLEAKEMGPVVFAAQEQQRPQVEGGGILKKDWYRFWHVMPGIPEPCLCEKCWTGERAVDNHRGANICEILPEGGLEALSLDATFEGSDTCDFVALGACRILSDRYFWLDVFNRRADVIETTDALKDMSKRFPKAFDKLIEKKANGPAIERTLRNEIPGMVLVEPLGSKEARAGACQVEFRGGQVFFPHPSLFPWVWPLIKQLEAFPKGAFDDMVDMVTLLILKYKAHGSGFGEAMRKLREGVKK